MAKGERANPLCETIFQPLFGVIEASASDESTRSKNVLEFYVEQVLRPSALDPGSVDSRICDSSGDRGLDAYVIDPDLGRVTLLQCKWFDNDGKKISEKDSLDLLRFYRVRYVGGDRSGVNDDVRAFLSRAKAQFKGWNVGLVYLTNGVLDASARKEYLSASEDEQVSFDIVDRLQLCEAYIQSLSQEEPIDNQVVLGLEDGGYFTWQFPGVKDLLGTSIEVVQCIARAVDLRRAYGRISNKLFIRNLRYGLAGKINEAMKQTAESEDRHAFYVFHNGISIVCEKLAVVDIKEGGKIDSSGAPEIDDEELDYLADLSGEGIRRALWMQNFQIVNGAQSTITLSDVPDDRLRDVRIPCKVSQAPSSDVAAMIARYNNTQNKITPVDLVANSAEQTLMQNYAATRFSPPIYYQRKRGEKWTDLLRASGKAPPKTRRLDFVRTYQAFLSFVGTPGGAYTRPSSMVYPDTPGYDQISDFADKDLVLLAGLLANYERAWQPPAKKTPHEWEKFWTHWAIAVFGHVYRVHLEDEFQEKIKRELLSDKGEAVWKRVRDGLVEIFETLFGDYFDKVEDYQDFFKNDEETFNLRGFTAVKVSEVAKYVHPKLRSKGDLYTMKQEHGNISTKIEYYEVNFAVVAAIVDRILQKDKSIIVKIRGS